MVSRNRIVWSIDIDNTKISNRASIFELTQNVRTVRSNCLHNELDQNQNLLISFDGFEKAEEYDDIIQIKNYVNGLLFSQSQLNQLTLDSLLERLLSPYVLSNLLVLDLSYVKLSKKAVDIVSFSVNVKNNRGFCPIRRLVLSRTNIGITSANNLLNSIHDNPHLEEILINGNKIGNSMMGILTESLKSNVDVWNNLNISCNDITNVGIAQELCRHLSNLNSLDIHGNPITDAGVYTLFSSLWRSTSIEYLNLSDTQVNLNNPKDYDWFSLIQLMLSLKELNLSHNSIDDVGLNIICISLKKSFSIRSLNLSYNNFGKSRKSFCLSDLVSTNHRLINLDVSFNNFHIDEFWSSLSLALTKNKTLLSLNLSGCKLNMNLISELCQSLSINDICTLSLENNHKLTYAVCKDPRKYFNVLTVSPYAESESLKNNREWSKQVKESVIKYRTILFAQEMSIKLNEDVDIIHTMRLNIENLLCKSTLLNELDFIEDNEKKNNLKSKSVQVTYGNDSEFLGFVEINQTTTYDDLKETVKSVLREYYKVSSIRSTSSLIENFVILDVTTQFPVTENDMVF